MNQYFLRIFCLLNSLTVVGCTSASPSKVKDHQSDTRSSDQASQDDSAGELSGGDDRSKVGEEPSDLPIEMCQGDLTASEQARIYRAGEFLSVSVGHYTRECQSQSERKECEAWVESEIPTPRHMYGSPQTTLSSKIKRTSRGIYIEMPGYYRWGGGKISQDGEHSNLLLMLHYKGYREVCDDYSHGGGWGSGGCLRSHYKYFDREWIELEGRISESCVSLVGNIRTSNISEFGEGITVFRESVHVLVNQ